MVFCRSMPRTERKTGSPTSGKTKAKDKINILHDNVLDATEAKTLCLRLRYD